jgi:hypothetical protein
MEPRHFRLLDQIGVALIEADDEDVVCARGGVYRQRGKEPNTHD